MGSFRDVDQMQYLQSSLESKDWSKVEHFTAMTEVWNMFNKLHGKTEVVVNEVLKGITNLGKVKKVYLDQYMIDLYYLLIKSQKQLEAVSAAEHLKSPVKVAEIAKTLPEREFREWCRDKQTLEGEPWDQLIVFLEKRGAAAEEFL